MSVAIAVVAGVFAVGLAASQLIRLKAWLSRPQGEYPPEPVDE